MAQATRGESAPETIWLHRLFERAPVPPVVVGLAVAAVIVAVYLAMEAGYGHIAPLPDGTPFWARCDLRDAILFALLIGYIPTAYGYADRGFNRAIGELRPLIRGSGEQLRGVIDHLTAGDARGLRIAGLVGLLAGVAFQTILWSSPSTFTRVWNHHALWYWLMTLALFWGLAQVLYLSRSRRLWRQLDAVPIEIDLLDLRPLAPYVRSGLRMALLWIIGISLGSLLMLGPDEFGGRLTLLQTGVLALSTAMASVALVVPVRGVHRRIRREKQAELDRLRAAIRGDRSALEGSQIESHAAELSLADLVAYKALIESVREWPFERATWLRFVLYLAIPIGSWMGGALVERGLGVFLD